MEEVLALASNTFRDYATRHGYEFVVGDNQAGGRPAAWGKVLLIRDLLDRYDEVLWIDSDAIILDGIVDIAGDVPEGAFQAMARPRNPDGQRMLNTGVWYLRGERAKEFLDLVWQQDQWIDHVWWEQRAVLDLLGFDDAGNNIAESEWLAGTAWFDDEWNVLEWIGGLVPCRIRHYSNRRNEFRSARMRIDLAYLDRRWDAALQDLRWRVSERDYALLRLPQAKGFSAVLRLRAKMIYESRRARSLTSSAAARVKRHLPDQVADTTGRALAMCSPSRRAARRWAAFQRMLRDDGIVLTGPFAGLRFGPGSSWGSALPLLLGSYESELHGVIEESIARGYSRIIDIGCAEGYYAVGMAQRSPRSAVIAVDVDPEARRLCAAMAERNDVADRVEMLETCTTMELEQLVDDRTLVICDCEGAERDLLDPVAAPSLALCDLIVELHDFVDPNTTALICDRFRATHDIELIDAVERAADDYPQLVSLELRDRRKVLDEHRPIDPHPMQWAVMRRRREV